MDTPTHLLPHACVTIITLSCNADLGSENDDPKSYKCVNKVCVTRLLSDTNFKTLYVLLTSITMGLTLMKCLLCICINTVILNLIYNYLIDAHFPYVDCSLSIIPNGNQYPIKSCWLSTLSHANDYILADVSSPTGINAGGPSSEIFD